MLELRQAGTADHPQRKASIGYEGCPSQDPSREINSQLYILLNAALGPSMGKSVWEILGGTWSVPSHPSQAEEQGFMPLTSIWDSCFFIWPEILVGTTGGCVAQQSWAERWAGRADNLQSNAKGPFGQEAWSMDQPESRSQRTLELFLPLGPGSQTNSYPSSLLNTAFITPNQ